MFLLVLFQPCQELKRWILHSGLLHLYHIVKLLKGVFNFREDGEGEICLLEGSNMKHISGTVFIFYL